MEVVTKIAPIALALIMLALGLGLTGQDFLRVAKQPKDFLVGLICQLILLPVIAFLLLKIFNLPLEIALGVMIIAAAPGGVTSNILTSFAKGDVALSISLTAIISLLSVVTVPLILIFGLELLKFENMAMNVSLFSISVSMFLIVVVPTIIGMLFNKFLNNFIQKIESIVRKISIALFVIVLLGAILAEKDNVISYFADAGLVTLVLNILMMILAFYIAQLFGSGASQKKCISIECGLQNGTLAIFVGTSLFGGGSFIIPAATYSLIMFLTSLIFVFFIKKID